MMVINQLRVNTDDLKNKESRPPTGCSIVEALLLAWVILFAGMLTAAAQEFRISSVTLTNSTLEMNFPGPSDSYYFLLARAGLINNQTPVDAVLGTDNTQAFLHSVSNSLTAFFRVQQLPIASTNCFLGDGIPDGWKLQYGLNPLGPSVANQIAPGDTRTWLQVYEDSTNTAALPLAFFPTASSTVLAGSSNATIQVAFTKPYSGYLTYQLSGTAIPSSSGVTGDYIDPSGSVYVPNSTLATISINLVPEPDIEVNRSIVIAISAPPSTNQTYTITTKSSVATIQIVQSTQGVFVGSMAITNDLFARAQSVKMALRPGTGTNTVALFDVIGNALLGNTFTVPVTVNSNGFQLSGAQFPNMLTNTPWGRNLSLNLSFGSTQPTNGAFTTPVTMLLNGLTASGRAYAGYGNLTLSRSQ